MKMNFTSRMYFHILFLVTLCVTASIAKAACTVNSFPWAENFESISPTGAGIAPPCWKVQTISGNGFTSAGASVRNTGAKSGAKFMYANYNSNSWLYTPAMQLSAGTTYYFYFNYALTDAISGYTIETAVGNGQRADSMTTTLGTLTNATNTFYKISVYSYTPTADGEYYFGIHSTAINSPWYFNIDDVGLSTSSPCAVNSIPWHEGFESTNNGAGNVPGCWATQVNSGNNWNSAGGVIRNGVSAHSGTRSMYGSYSSDAWMFTPDIQLTGGTKYYFSFYYAVTDATPGYTVTTAVGTSQSASAMSTTLGTITNPVNTNYQEALYEYTPPVTGTYNFGIRANYPNSSAWYFVVDDVSIYNSTCQRPVSHTATITSDSSITANWSCSGCTGSYLVEYGPATTFTTPGTDTGAGPNGKVIRVASGISSVSISGLTPSVQYRYFIRQDCGAGSYSVNSTSQQVATSYCKAIYTTGCSASDAIIDFTLANLNHTASGCSPAGYGDFTSSQPVINLVSGATYPWTASINYSSGHYLQMWIDVNDNGIFDASEALLATPFAQPNNTANIPFGSSFTLPSSTPGGTHRFRVRIVYTTPNFDACTVYTYGEVQDYTCNVAIPSCTIPTSSSATSIDLTSAQANWTCYNGCTGSYVVEYGPAATFTTPGTGATAGANGTVVNVTAGNLNKLITSLTNGTTYTYYVRQNCGSGYSLNSAPQTFTTKARLNVGTIAINQQVSIVAPGTNKVNILRVDLPVAGDTGNLLLNSIKFTSANTSDADISALGVKLWTGNTTTAVTQIGTAQTFASGAVTFTGLNLSLVNGITYYLWLTYDISPTATVQHLADAKIATGDINITTSNGAIDESRPALLLDPTGAVTIYYCSANLYSSSCTGGDEIGAFSIANLNHTGTGCSSATGMYGNFTVSQPAIQLYRDSTYSWLITNSYAYGHHAQLWIDYNDNGVFTDAGEQLLLTSFPQPDTRSLPSPNTNIPFGSTISIPSNAPLGLHQFRVRLVWSNPNFGPCDQQSYGEVHDYTVLITDAAITCTNAAGTAGTVLADICSGRNTELTITGYTGSLQWQQSAAGANIWTAVTGGSADTLPAYTTAALTTSTDYRAAVSQAGCQDEYSNALSIQVTPAVNPTVTIVTDSTTICKGENVTFTATPVNGGTAPTYTWKVNSIEQSTPLGTYTSSMLNDKDTVTTTLISNATCATNPATSNEIVMTVNPVPDVTLSIPANICQGSGMLDLTDMGQPAGGNYTGTGVSGTNFNLSQTAGIYVVEYKYTDGNNCSLQVYDTTTLSICTSVINAGHENTILILPNPSTGIFTVRSTEKITALQVQNLEGQLVIDQPVQNNTTIQNVDLRTYPKGIYFLSLRSANRTFTQKIVLQ